MVNDHRLTHTRHYPTFTKDELLSMEYTDGGMIRHTIVNTDNTVEAVGLNNLVAVISRFCTDPLGNHFGAYFVIPDDFWRMLCKREILEKLGRGPDTLPIDDNGGVLGLLSNCTIYVGGTDLVLMRNDHTGLCWSFTIGTEHALRDRTNIRELVGMNMGFDMEFPFFPTLNWAPVPLIEEWAANGLISAQNALKNPQLYEYWERKNLLEQQDNSRELTDGTSP